MIWALTDSQKDRILHDPSPLVIVAVVLAGFGIRALWRRWYDRRLSPDKAAALANEEAQLSSFRRMRRGLSISSRNPTLDTTWEQTYRDETQWRRTDDQP